MCILAQFKTYRKSKGKLQYMFSHFYVITIHTIYRVMIMQNVLGLLKLILIFNLVIKRKN